MSNYGVISGPYFPVFGLNTEIYELNQTLDHQGQHSRKHSPLVQDINEESKRSCLRGSVKMMVLKFW